MSRGSAACLANAGRADALPAQPTRRAGALCAALCVALSACATAPVRPSAKSTRVADTLVDAKVAIAPSSLSTTGAWPAGGAAGKAALRAFLVDELNHMIGATGKASVTLQTEAVLEHVRLSGNRESLRAILTTRLPSGDLVETTHTVAWALAAGSPLIGALPIDSGFPVGALGCCSPCGFVPALGWWPACGTVGGASLAAALVIGAVATLAVAAAIVVALVVNQNAQFDSSRTTAFSDGLQRTLRAHARAVRNGLAIRSEPVPLIERQHGGDEPTSERELPSDASPWDQPPDDAGDPVDAETPHPETGADTSPDARRYRCCLASSSPTASQCSGERA